MKSKRLMVAVMCLVASASMAPAQWNSKEGTVEDVSWRKSDGEFGAMLVLTRHPDEFLADWDTPPREGFTPAIKAADGVVRDELIAAFVVFSGCMAGEDGNCLSDVDFVVNKPNGERYADVIGAELWSEKAAPLDGALQVGTGYLAVIIEPEDPLGEYTVMARVCDRIRGICFDLSRTFDARDASVELDSDGFLQQYYQDPRPALVGAAISHMSASGSLNSDDAVPPVVGFFSVVFHANPDRIPGWRTIIDNQDERAQLVFDAAFELANDPSLLTTTPDRSPSLNDMLWGAFFGSGDTRYVEAIVDQLRFLGEREDLNLFLTAGSAQWSLSSNARQHPVVRAKLNELVKSADDSLKKALEDALTVKPSLLRQRMVETLQRQHSAGVW